MWESISNYSAISDKIGSMMWKLFSSSALDNDTNMSIIGAVILFFLMAFMMAIGVSIDVALVIGLGGIILLSGAGMFGSFGYYLALTAVGILVFYALTRILRR